MKVLQVNSPRSAALLRLFLKAAFIVVISMVTSSSASAQHCDGCNVNIYGEETVRVGDTKTYYINPRLPNVTYTPIWDEYGYLSSYATIIDQGKNASGQEYITLYFFDDGWTWLNYAGLYPGITEDYDEITLHILP